VQVEFSIVGMTASPAFDTLEVVPNTPLTGQFTLTDLSATPLTGITAAAQGGPAGLVVQLTSPSQISGNGTATLAYALRANSSSVSGPVVFHVTSAEGAVFDIPINIDVIPATPELVSNPGYLDTGMLVGTQSLVTITVVNDGGSKWELTSASAQHVPGDHSLAGTGRILHRDP
jgi:hypothetical protein